MKSGCLLLDQFHPGYRETHNPGFPGIPMKITTRKSCADNGIVPKIHGYSLKKLKNPIRFYFLLIIPL